VRPSVPCSACLVGRPPTDPFLLVQGELDDKGFVEIECPKGHRSAVIFNARRYEILLRSGAKALLQGFASESIFSMHAALERAYEFFIRVVCRHHEIPPEQIDAAWKGMARQSERQLGAFSILYLLEMGKPLPLPEGIATMRNDVVHKGHIATEVEARKFGEMVFRRIREIEQALARLPEAVRAEAEHELEEMRQSIPAGLERGVFEVHSIQHQDGVITGPSSTFEQYLTGIEQGLAKGWA
jgi:hypothetical protein